MEKAKRDAVRALAGAVLKRAKDDWLDDNWHDDVESFLPDSFTYQDVGLK